MTTSPCLPCTSSPPVREPVASLGAWLFVPDRRNAVGDVTTGYLSRNGERVVLAHTSRPLADFVRKISQLESDFAARIGSLLFPAES
ncbi:hypothetical protein [Kitasatospora sp. NPDC127060]|uniref:hypothetical protein n=1 Tax=Kitasatospora sp. NPDC127060 TaxID=3347121 RepID=UPI003667D4C8